MQYNGQREPRLRSVLQSLLLDGIYAPIKAVFAKRLSQITDNNVAISQTFDISFMYKGIYYTQYPDLRQPRIKPRLVPELYERMDEYLADLQEITGYEKAIVSGYLSAAVTAAKYPEDLLVLLPESIQYPLQEYLEGYPDNASKISPEAVSELQTRHSKAIELMKQRLVLNLLI